LHLASSGQLEVQHRWRIARQRVEVRQALPAHRTHTRLLHHRVVQVQGRALAEADETARVDPVPATRAAVVDDGRTARIHHGAGSQIAVAGAFGTRVGVHPGTPGDARQLLAGGLEGQVVLDRSARDLAAAAFRDAGIGRLPHVHLDRLRRLGLDAGGLTTFDAGQEQRGDRESDDWRTQHAGQQAASTAQDGKTDPLVALAQAQRSPKLALAPTPLHAPAVSLAAGVLKLVKELAKHVFRHPLLGIAAAARTPDGRWLLIRRGNTGTWALPGGALD